MIYSFYDFIVHHHHLASMVYINFGLITAFVVFRFYNQLFEDEALGFLLVVLFILILVWPIVVMRSVWNLLKSKKAARFLLTPLFSRKKDANDI